MGKKRQFLMLVALGLGVISLVGCAHVREKSTGSGYVTASIAYPTGREGSSNILLEKTYPQVIRLGKTYDYTIKVVNLTDLQLSNVKISEVVPAGFSLISSEPAVSNRIGDKVEWNIGNLEGRKTVSIKVSGKADQKIDLPCCTSADYVTPALCLDTKVIQPALAVEVSAPQQVVICDAIPLLFTIKNTGDGMISDAKIVSQLPAGLTVGGKSDVTISVGSLAAGDSKKYSALARSEKVGVQVVTANATASDGLSAAATTSTSIVQPVLTVSASAAKDKQFVGRGVNYSVTVRNQGNVTADATVVSARLAGARANSASEKGTVSAGKVSWDVGALAPGASKTFSVDAIATDAGSATITAMAEAVCSNLVNASAATDIVGIPAILLEVVDVADPVEVGSEETYEITVTNQGTAPDSNIKVVATFDKNQEYVSASGPTNGSISGNTVTFAPLSMLGAKDSVTWRVVVKGAAVGDARFRVTMNSDQLTQNVEETEATNIY